MLQIVAQHPLRKWRKSVGLTLDQVAARLNTSRQVVSDWERGRRRPGPAFMPRVRELTGGMVTADDFFPDIERAA